MTDRIDLDDLETETDEERTEGNYGDWLWRDDGPADPSNEPDSPWGGPSSAAETNSAREGVDDATSNESGAEPDRTPAPHVPRTGDRTPVGLPTADGDGEPAGTGTEAGSSTPSTDTPESKSLRPMGAGAKAASDAETDDEDAAEPASASGPHGSGPDEMTMAITYRALRRLSHPAAVFAGAYEWCDWVGIVGDVPAHVVQKFQRDRGIDVDFFNGSGTGPGERLAEIDRNSMFYADRMVVVGVEGADEPVAEAAGWEFVSLETAAEKAGWELESDAP